MADRIITTVTSAASITTGEWVKLHHRSESKNRPSAVFGVEDFTASLMTAP